MSATGAETGDLSGDTVFSPTWESLACDPDILKVNGTYYLYYGADLPSDNKGVLNPWQGVIMVAHGPTITGPFTARRSLIFNPYGDNNQYGAGQPSTVLMPNGEVWMWYTVGGWPWEIWLAKSSNPESFDQGVKTNVAAGPPGYNTANVGVVFNDDTGLLEMYYVHTYDINGGNVVVRTSTDGITWSDETVLYKAPNWAFDGGITKDPTGHYHSGAYTRWYKGAKPIVMVPNYDAVWTVQRLLWGVILP